MAIKGLLVAKGSTLTSDSYKPAGLLITSHVRRAIVFTCPYLSHAVVSILIGILSSNLACATSDGTSSCAFQKHKIESSVVSLTKICGFCTKRLTI